MFEVVFHAHRRMAPAFQAVARSRPGDWCLHWECQLLCVVWDEPLIRLAQEGLRWDSDSHMSIARWLSHALACLATRDDLVYPLCVLATDADRA